MTKETSPVRHAPAWVFGVAVFGAVAALDYLGLRRAEATDEPIYAGHQPGSVAAEWTFEAELRDYYVICAEVDDAEIFADATFACEAGSIAGQAFPIEPKDVAEPRAWRADDSPDPSSGLFKLFGPCFMARSLRVVVKARLVDGSDAARRALRGFHVVRCRDIMERGGRIRRFNSMLGVGLVLGLMTIVLVKAGRAVARRLEPRAARGD